MKSIFLTVFLLSLSLFANELEKVYGWDKMDWIFDTQEERNISIIESKAAYLVELQLGSTLDTSGVVWSDDDNGFVRFGTNVYLLADECTGTFCGMIPTPASRLVYDSGNDTPEKVKDAVINGIDFSQINSAVSKMRQAYADGTWQSTLEFPKRDSVN